MKVKYITDPGRVPQLSEEDIRMSSAVSDKFAFRTNDYYNSLIDWSDPDDPIKRLTFPQADELSAWGELDASNEKMYQPVRGLEHKYLSTALLLCNDVCAVYCRFCFRKRLFQNGNDEVVRDVTNGVAYISSHPEINNVLLTGGDPLVMSTANIKKIIDQLMAIDHVKIIRIGTKIPAFNPYRILDDPSLLQLFESYRDRKQIYIMTHFNHPVELTEPAVESLRLLRNSGATIFNQTPIINGVNDSVPVLSSLLEQISYKGVTPYYVFVCRPTEGNKSFALPIEKAYQIYASALNSLSGIAKNARFIMSHAIGKIEIVGLTDDHIYFRYHNMVNESTNGMLDVRKRNPDAYWLEDYDDFTVKGC